MESIPTIKPDSAPIQQPERITTAAIGLTCGNGDKSSLERTAETVKTDIQTNLPAVGLLDSKDKTPQIRPVRIIPRLIR